MCSKSRAPAAQTVGASSCTSLTQKTREKSGRESCSIKKAGTSNKKLKRTSRGSSTTLHRVDAREQVHEAADSSMYGSQAYWQERYLHPPPDATSEWLFGWEQLAPLLLGRLPADASVIDVGCGTSTLVFDLAEAYTGRVVGIDNAPSALECLREELRRRVAAASVNKRAKGACSRVELHTLDATQLSALGEGAFDCCVDKSTLDAMLCDERDGARLVAEMYAQIAQVLKPDATVLLVSWRQPEQGLEWLRELVLEPLVQATAEVDATRNAQTRASRKPQRQVAELSAGTADVGRQAVKRGPHRAGAAAEDVQEKRSAGVWPGEAGAAKGVAKGASNSVADGVAQKYALDDASTTHWSVGVHAVDSEAQAQRHWPAPPPTVYLITRRSRRVLTRPSCMRADEAEPSISIRFHMHK
eukprot:6193957-Pleurochrysis_carterae.AAC.3